MANPKEAKTAEGQAKGPVIVLSQDRKPQLTAKLAEYRERTQQGDDRYRHPDLQLLMHSDAMYKITVLEKLLKEGRVATFDLSLEMAEKLGPEFDPDLFTTACGVINDYNETGGANIYGGTGLPQV